jgi:hypothetical protein
MWQQGILVVEKANTFYSGSGGLGNDHFMCYIPEVHGPDVEPMIDEFQRGQQGGLRNRSFIRTWLERSYEIVKLWDSFGIPGYDNGGYRIDFSWHPGKLPSIKDYPCPSRWCISLFGWKD